YFAAAAPHRQFEIRVIAKILAAAGIELGIALVEFFFAGFGVFDVLPDIAHAAAGQGVKGAMLEDVDKSLLPLIQQLLAALKGEFFPSAPAIGGVEHMHVGSVAVFFG